MPNATETDETRATDEIPIPDPVPLAAQASRHLRAIHHIGDPSGDELEHAGHAGDRFSTLELEGDQGDDGDQGDEGDEGDELEGDDGDELEGDDGDELEGEGEKLRTTPAAKPTRRGTRARKGGK